MTPEEFVVAVNATGLKLEPRPGINDDCQYQSPWDPTRHERSSITREEGLILAKWASGKRILEIGTGLGISTVCLAYQADCVITVDPSEWVRWALDLPWNVRKCASIDEVSGEMPFDGVFIDGLHGYDDVVRDITHALAFVKVGGEIGFHDLGQEEVIRAVDLFKWGARRRFPTVGVLTFCEVIA